MNGRRVPLVVACLVCANVVLQAYLLRRSTQGQEHKSDNTFPELLMWAAKGWPARGELLGPDREFDELHFPDDPLGPLGDLQTPLELDAWKPDVDGGSSEFASFTTYQARLRATRARAAEAGATLLNVVAVGAVLREEDGPYLCEWIEYHRCILGVQNFFLAGGSCVRREAATGGGSGSNARCKVRWLALIAVDKYIVLASPNSTLLDVLVPHAQLGHSEVVFPTRAFGTSFHRQPPVSSSVLAAYTLRATLDDHDARVRALATFLRPAVCLQLSASGACALHVNQADVCVALAGARECESPSLSSRRSSGRKEQARAATTRSSYALELHHYATRSEVEWEQGLRAQIGRSAALPPLPHELNAEIDFDVIERVEARLEMDKQPLAPGLQTCSSARLSRLLLAGAPSKSERAKALANPARWKAVKYTVRLLKAGGPGQDASKTSNDLAAALLRTRGMTLGGG